MGDGGRGHHHGRLLLDVSGRERHAPWSVRSQPPSPSCSLESSLRPRAGPGDLGRRARLVGDRPGEEKSPTLCARPRLRGGPGWRGSEGEKGRRRVPGTGLGSSAPRQGGGRAVGHQGAWSTWGPPRAWLLGQESAAWRAAEQGSSSTGVPETAAFGSWPAEGPAATQRTPGVGLGTPRVASRTPLHQERAQSRSWCFRDRTAGKLVKMSKGVRGGGRRGTVQSIAAGTKCKAEKSDCSWGRGVVVIKSD